MASGGLIIRDRNTGREKLNSFFNTGSRAGLIDIGGAGAPQTGAVYNPILLEGRAFSVVLDGPVIFARDNIYPTIWTDGPYVRWSFPASGSNERERPRLRIMYGIY